MISISFHTLKLTAPKSSVCVVVWMVVLVLTRSVVAQDEITFGPLWSTYDGAGEALHSTLDLMVTDADDGLRQDHGFVEGIMADHRHFYSTQSLVWLGAGLSVGAAIANTPADEEIYSWFQSGVRGATSDEWTETLHANKELGNGLYTLPIMATAWAAGELFDQAPGSAPLSEWGERSLRTFIVGVPPVIVAQRLTGGSRPGESGRESAWQPFVDANGVSGHSFMSALPFINAAKVAEDPWLKAGFYAGSLLGPLSRINDEAHYPSQAALGWWFAYIASTAVDRTQQDRRPFPVQPYILPDEVGAVVALSY